VSHIGDPVIPVYFESDLDMARQALYSLFAFFLLLPAVFGPQGRGLIRRFLQWWPMAALGVISYGIYLWHETWIYQILGQGHYHDFDLEFWAFFLSVMGLSIMSASLSYFIVEKPALRLKNSLDWWRRTTGPTEGPTRTADAAPTDQPRDRHTDGDRGASDTTASDQDAPDEGDPAGRDAESDTELRTI
jgi:peptidoglycan/LPS O-acetylase OafA/YrhL